MQPANLLFIMSDEHNKRVLGCYGHPMIKTPSLDRLAAHGTRFSNAYTNCPICVPARASFATGRYVHQVRCWDNAIAYSGQAPSWGHRLMEQGHRVESIGKLHYKESNPKVNGFNEEILPLHIVAGVGDLLGLIRDELPRRPGSAKLGPEAGRGESEYTHYDRCIADTTARWLKEQAPGYGGKPWALYVGFVSPHFPLIAPAEFYDLYPEDKVPWPDMYEHDKRPRHPFTDAMRKCLCFDEPFDPPMVRRAVAAYFGLVSFLDDNIGKILKVLEETGLAANTRVIYTSDHGDNLGTRGMWGKSTMYEESAGVPLIMAGPQVPADTVCPTPVSLVDGFPTFMQALGARPDPRDNDLPGHSLLEIAQGFAPQRTILSEYHAAGALTGSYMIRHGKYKYIHYVGLPPMLFDLEADPYERMDLGRDPACKEVIAECEERLRKVVDPEAVDKLAKADQQAHIEKHGGKEAILKRGTFRYSPPPGAKAAYY
ncbi:MAG: sulfatase [Betaproteobacteria bacterium RIFCSPLOWO2_12_FULL_62_13]|nr:MAG: sulfatase [Betaproteobacteria bacterium RIFCSPLOWO2_12_FULL_62_13]